MIMDLNCLLTVVCVKAESGPTFIVIVPPIGSSFMLNCPPLRELLPASLRVVFGNVSACKVKLPNPLFCGRGVACGSDKAWENAKVPQKETKYFV